MTEYKITRSKDFSESGEYDLTANNTTVQIYRDTFQFSYPIWYCVQHPRLFAYTKKEIIQKVLEVI